MMHTLKASKYGLDYEKAELVAGACINQSLQQQISKQASKTKASRKTEGKPSKSVLNEFKQRVKSLLTLEYLRPDGWRIPIFDYDT